ncbi:MAG: HD domain-containing protein, partial [Planctomycetaceae bacterium]
MHASPVVARATAAVAALRERIRADHAAGVAATACCARASDAYDDVVVAVWEAALETLPEEARAAAHGGVALAAIGGFGRRCMAPHSDIDLCLLHRPGVESHVPALARRLLQDLFDAGLDVGQSVRTADEALALAASDATVFTALLDARPLAGAASIVTDLAARLADLARADRPQAVRRLLEGRRMEVERHGGTMALLEPNVKRSAGCLRDVHLLRWLGAVLHDEPRLERLAERGILSGDDVRGVAAAEAFLLRARVELHLAAGRAADDLTRDEQPRIANAWGYAPRAGLLPVERFMQEFFGHTRHVASVLEALGPEEDATDVAPTAVRDGPFVVTDHHVAAVPGEAGRVADDPAAVVRLVDLAARHGLPLGRATWRAVRAGRAGRDDGADAATVAAFLDLFERPASLAPSLRRLHEVGVLERIVPPFRHARDLLQFNNYHKYTVDEHCILAVERAAGWAADPGWLGDEWARLSRKRPLLVALLVHDLGKGFPEDHSILGARLADDVAARLGLPADEREIVTFLVLEHLTMAHLAFRRDADDDSLVVPFARRVGSPEVLRMLALLTAADVAAVGPGT